jgi:hypothetical protein
MCRTILFLLALSVSSAAMARDATGRYADSPYHEWYEEQRDVYGILCCDRADARWYEGSYTINANGTVTLNLPGGDLIIEAYKVLKGPNPTGHPVLWQNALGATACFSPGPQT